MGHSGMLINVSNKNQLNDFINLPNFIYSDDPNWVTPRVGVSPREFNRNANPALRYHDLELYLTSDGKDFTGRIAAFVDNNYNLIHNEKTAFFGFFEARDSIETASELLTGAADFAQSRGMSRLVGPVEFTTNYQAGLLVQGFDRPTVMTPYNKKYYPKLLESNGFKKLLDLYAYRFANPAMPERVSRMAAILEKRNAQIRVLSFREAGRLCKASTITDLHNKAFCDNWGYVPMTTKEFSHLLSFLAHLNYLDFNYLAVCKSTPVGLLLTVPDFYAQPSRKRNQHQEFKDIRVTVLGVLPAYRKRGIESCLGARALEDAIINGCQTMEFSYILENNSAMNNYVSREFGIPVSKTFRIYEKALG